MQVAALKQILIQLRDGRETPEDDRYEKAQEPQLDQHLLLEEIGRLKTDLRQHSFILNSLPFPIWLRDGHLNITFRNLAYIELLEDSLASDTHDAHLVELSTQAIALEAQQLHKTCSMKISFARQEPYYEVTEIPLTRQDMQLGFALPCEAENVTEVAEESSAFEYEEQHLAPTSIYDASMVLQYYNEAFCEMWHLSHEFLDQKPTYHEVITALREDRSLPERADFKKFKEERTRMFKELASPYIEQLHLPDGRSINLEINRHHKGGLIFTFDDITQRLSIESTLNMQNAVHKAVLDQLKEGIAIFAQNGKLTYYNQAYIDIWGLDDDALSRFPHIREIVMILQSHCYKPDWNKCNESFVRILSERVAIQDKIRHIDGRLIDHLFAPLPNGGIMLSIDVDQPEQDSHDKVVTLKRA